MKFTFIDGLFTYNLPCFCGQCKYTYNSWIYIWIGISDRRCERCVHSGTMEEISNMMSMITWINVNIPFTSPWAKLKVWNKNLTEILESKLPEMEVRIQHEQQEVPMKNIHPSRIPIVLASAAVTPKLLALKITASALAMVSHCL